MNIVILDASTLGDIAALEELNQLGTVSRYEVTSPQQTIERLQGQQVVLTNKVVIDREVMDACPEMQLICITATGMNNVDLAYAKEKGITVKNVAGYSTYSVAQTAFAMLLQLFMPMQHYDNYVKSRTYSESPVFTYHGVGFSELQGKRFGIVGMGAIGKQVAAIASAFGAEVVYFSTSGKNNNAGYEQVNFDELLTTSDIISIHCPLNEQTRNLFSYAEFVMMKPTAFILNLGRGGILNEADLARAINAGNIAGAGIDVLEKEPMDAQNPLLSLEHPEKVILTPHIAWASQEARELLMQGVLKNIRDFLVQTR